MEEEVISMIKSCIVSSKRGVPLVDIDGEYRELVGNSIPYQKFGYQSLGNFIAKIPGIEVNRTENGNTVLTIFDAKIAHITALVEKQKSAVPKRRKKNFSKIPPKPKKWEITTKKKSMWENSVDKENFDARENFQHKRRHFKNSYDMNEVPSRQALSTWCSPPSIHDSYQDQLRDFIYYNDLIHSRFLETPGFNYSSYYRTTRMVDNMLKITVDNTSHSDDSSHDSVQFYNSFTEVDAYNFNMKTHSNSLDYNLKYYIEPSLFHHQLIGDDFFLHLAERSLRAHTVRRRGELYSAGLCSSGLTIRRCLRKVVETRLLADRIILLVGAVDILQTTDIADMKADMLDLIELLESRVSSLVILTIPPLVNICHLERPWDTLVKFNKWLKRMDIGYKLQVIDTWPILRGHRMYDYYEHFPRSTIQRSAFIVLWNHQGRKSMTELLRKKVT